MKKFSKLTNQKVTEEPKVETKKIDEGEIIKYKMIDLMDKFLSIQTYGPVDRHQRAGLIKIMGKEMLAEAISDMLIDISNKDKTKLLESLKSEISFFSSSLFVRDTSRILKASLLLCQRSPNSSPVSERAA